MIGSSTFVYRLRGLRGLRLALLSLLAFPLLAFGAAGEAVFVRGDVRVIRADGTERSLAVGEQVRAGESLRAGADGYAHLRFPDGGFVGVRPGSRFVLEDYATDASAEGGVRVRYRLENGSVRAITGETVERNKNRFRLNTPVAAVGVRGTDYVVQAGEDLTRASVNSGAIVMAPLGPGCEAAGLGACETAAARTLAAGAAAGSYIEYRAGSQAPEIKRSAPPGVAPAAPDEPASASAKRADSSVGTVDTTISAAASRVGAVVSALPPAQPPLPELPVTPPPPPPSEVVWGRWSNIAAATPTVVEQLEKGYKPWMSTTAFGLLVREMVTDMPRQGVVGFNLTGSEAYVREGANLSAASVSDAKLTVDFGARRFDTSLVVSGAGVDSAMSASGKVDWQGTLISEASRSTMQVLGVLGGPAARDAGYLFEKPLNTGAVIQGATSWRR